MNLPRQPSAEESLSDRPKLFSRPYRSKKFKPCDLCRARKVACTVEDGATTCSLCRRRGSICTFRSRPGVKKRPGSQTSRQGPSDMDPISLEIRFQARTDVVANKSADTSWFDQTINMKDHICFYAGLSGDQGPDLLRHLSFNRQNFFGSNSWGAWRIHPHIQDPVYFTIFPESSLDSHCDMYTNNKVEQLLGHNAPRLIELYYTYVYPSYPIMEPMEELLQRWKHSRVRTSLMSCVYLLAVDFWSKSPSLTHQTPPKLSEFWNEIFVALSIETRTPNLDTVKGLLLFMQLRSHRIKEPNRPGQWALSCMLAGVAQDLGLHVDPSDWQIPLAERQSRRILWWAIFAHDKWTAHFLGRPPHLSSAICNVRPLTVSDFTDELAMIHLDKLASSRVLIAFIELSCILEGVLEGFCMAPGKNHGIQVWSDTASAILTKLSDCRKKIEVLRVELPESPSVSSLRIACYTIELSLWRAALRQGQHPLGDTSQLMVQTIEEIMQTLARLHLSDVDDFWPPYCTGNLEIVGSVLVMLCVSSTDEQILGRHINLLLEFRSHLQNMSQVKDSMYEIGTLPLVRLNLILNQLSLEQSHS